MKRNSIRLAGATLCLLLPVLGSAIETGAAAPACTLGALGASPALDTATLKGKVVYVDFWASWCVPCVKSFPFLNTLHRDLKGRGLEVVAVDVDERVPDGTAFLRNHQAQFTVGSDPRGNCPKAFGLHGMPTSYLIDRQGVVRLVHTGYRDGEAVEVRHQIETVLMEDGQGPIAPAASHDMDHMEHMDHMDHMDHAQADH